MTEKEIASLKRSAIKHVIPHFANYDQLTKSPKIFVKGEGPYLFDIEGNKYLDTFASLLTTITGHGREEIAAITAKQMHELEFFPNYVDTFTVPLIELAEKLAGICPGDLSVSFYVNSGSEANETAIKMAKQYHYEKGRTGKFKIIARRHSYHATTLGGTSATGIPWFRELFEPLLPGFLFAPSAQCFHCELEQDPSSCGLLCLKQLRTLIEWEGPDSVAALIMDPIPGSNVGYPLPPTGYLQGVRALCDEHDILLIFDEIQTGFGKTGKMFACEHWNVTPDIMTLGKGLTGGFLPLGVTMTTPKIYEAFSRPGSELRSGSTYGGHTTACATTLANIDIIEKEGLVERAATMGAYFAEGFEAMSRKHAIIGDVRGIGMLWALDLLVDRKSKRPLDKKLNVGGWIRDYCWERGMILRNNGDILVIAPALILTREQAEFMLGMVDEAIGAAAKQFTR